MYSLRNPGLECNNRKRYSQFSLLGSRSHREMLDLVSRLKIEVWFITFFFYLVLLFLCSSIRYYFSLCIALLLEVSLSIFSGKYFCPILPSDSETGITALSGNEWRINLQLLWEWMLRSRLRERPPGNGARLRLKCFMFFSLSLDIWLFASEHM